MSLAPRTRHQWIAALAVVAGMIGVMSTRHVALPQPRHAGAATPASAGAPVSEPTSPARVEELTFVSTILDREMPYVVYLPPGYDDVDTHYPVLYMLHGLGGTCHEWMRYGLLDTAERMMRAGEIAPFIIVLAQGDQAYWVNHADGGPAWGTYVASDLVQEIDTHYRTIADRTHRGIGGDSMGGHGALQLAINNPSVFGIVGAHSFALRRRDTAPAYFGDQAAFDQRDPVYLYRTRAATARTLKLWLDIGDQDTWAPAARAFDAELTGEHIPHRWHEWPGGHNADYWSAHVTDYLRFYGDALAGG